jgi:hypothetical protein
MANSQFPWNQVNVMVQDYIIPTIRDQVFLSNAMFMRMKGKTKHFVGGRRIVVPLGWRTQGGLKWFSGSDVFSPIVRDPFQAAEFTAKNANVDLTIDWESEMIASGPEKVMDLMDAKGEWARNTFFDGMGSDIYNDGTDPKALGGLQFALAEGAAGGDLPPTQTYGGISRSSTVNTWWNHHSRNTAILTTGDRGTFLTNAAVAPEQPLMTFAEPNRMFARIKLASGKAPTMILSNVGAWTDVHWNLVRNERYNRPQQNSDLFKAGFENFMFRSAAWVQDEKAPRTTDANKDEKVYFIHEPAVRLHVDSRADFAFEPFRKPHNQMVRVAYILWRGEFIISEPRSCGVIARVRTSTVS